MSKEIRTAAQCKAKIEALYQIGSELSGVIEKGYLIVSSLEDVDLRETYLKDLEPMVDELKNFNTDLIEALEEYFKAEKAENLPASLVMRSLFRQLKA